MAWYTSYKGQRITGIVYSVGASVVIVGALFKILHWPGASMVLMLGMFTEAFLFIIGVLDAPHPVYQWEQVFPQLISKDHGAEPELVDSLADKARPTLLGGVGGGAAASAAPASAGVSLPSAALSDKEQATLTEGIQKLAKTAAQLSDLGSVAVSTAKLGEKLDVAGVAMEKFAASASNMSGQTEAYQQGMSAVNANLSNLSAVYELQLKNAKAQADAIKNQTAQVEAMADDLKKAATATSAAAKSSEAYEAAAKQLAAQVADLNKVYGNMLNALA